MLSEDIFALQIPNNFDHFGFFFSIDANSSEIIFVKKEVPWHDKL